jgi:hypothetical protein
MLPTWMIVGIACLLVISGLALVWLRGASGVPFNSDNGDAP